MVTIGDMPYAISLCAEKDLATVLGKETTIQDHDIMYGIKAMKGIAGALKFLHTKLTREVDHVETVYCHFDVKPANILVFSTNGTDLGKWKLIDFGISSISRPETKITATGHRENGRPRITYTVATTPKQMGDNYQAPEVYKQKENEMGRGSDIWSFGCIFVEVLAAKLGTLVDLRKQMDSKNNGRFFQSTCCSKTKSTLNKPLKDWLKKLPRELPQREALLEDCQDIIVKTMQIKRCKRITSEALVRELDELVTRNVFT